VFAVLAHLLAHRDRVVTRDELLESVWGHRFLADSTLASRIKAARRAIGDSGADQRLIRTVRGTGFRFVGDVVVQSPEPGSASTVVRDDAPVRRDELRRLRAALADATSGRRRVVFVSGESGSGKSTLVTRLAEEAGGLPGVRVAIGRCVEHRGEGEPYLPVLDALARLCERPDRDGVVAVLRARAPTWLAELPWVGVGAPMQTSAARTPERMLREMVEATDALAAQAPLLLTLEDVHWSDPSTLDLLAALARRPRAAGLLVAATYRPGESPAGHPLRALVPALLVERAAEEVRLGPLDEAGVAAILAARSPGLEADAPLLRLLHARTNGNPLFVHSVIEDWRSGGAVEDGGGAWRRSATIDALARRVPESARRLIEARIETLDAELLPLLEAGSVLGRTFSSAAVAAMLDIGAADTEERCVRLAGDGGMLRADGVEVWEDGTVAERLAFVHDLHREVVYARLPAGRRARLHSRAARWLETAHGPRTAEFASELADHFIRGREDEPAVRWSRAAAEHALSRGARREAVDHLHACLAVLARRPDLPDGRLHELAALTLLAPALTALKGWSAPEAEAAYRRVRELANALGERQRASDALFGLAVLNEYRGEYTTTQALLEDRLREDAAESRSAAAASHELLACSLFHQGAFSAALEHAERALSYGPAEPDVAMVAMGEDTLVSCHAWASLALWALDEPEAALERAATAVALARSPERAHGLAFALVNKARLQQLLGNSEHAGGPAAEAAAIAAEQGIPYLGAAARILAGWSSACTGSEAEGHAELRAGLDAHAATGARMDRAYFLGLLADACLRTGSIDDGRAAVREALALAGPHRPFFYEPALHRLQGELLAAAGEHAAAAAALDAAIASARRLGGPVLERRAGATRVPGHGAPR
jgi:DNA-binding winged helix-turn-helix (wHTH) protein/tetratricopeptide (TPR) repeat protein